MTTTQQLLTKLEESNLLTKEQLTEVYTDADDDPKVFAGKLVKNQLLTRWQAGMLLAGKDKFYLGKYKLLDHLGQGGMGAVFKAEQSGINRTVALKVMSRAVLKDPTAVERFLREIRSAAALEHTNIVRAYDADCVADTYFLVMEHVQGRDLKAWIKQYKKLPVDWSCEVVRQAAEGLQHAHEKGLVHRDIKPANLLIIADHSLQKPVVKILDMGLARFVSDSQEEGGLTQTGQVMGTPDFIAPEQAQSTKHADIRADIFSLGCTLFQMITGRLPYLGDNVMEKLMARGMSDAPRLKSIIPEIPDELDEIVAKMLARNPAQRYQTPQELVVALQPYALATSEASTTDQTMQLDKPEETLLDTPEQTKPDATMNEFLHSMSNQALMTPLPVKTKPSGNKGILYGSVTVALLLLIGLGYMWMVGGKGEDANTKSDISTTAKKNASAKSPDRQLAELVLKNSGTIKIVLSAGGEEYPKSKIEELPRSQFAVTYVQPDFQHFESPYKGHDGTVRGRREYLIELLSQIEQVKAVRFLDLQGSYMTDAETKSLSHLKALEKINMTSCKVTGVGLKHLAGLENLKHFEHHLSPASDSSLLNISKLQNLQILEVSGGGVTSAGIKHLMQLSQLRYLSLKTPTIDDEGMSYIANIASLKELHIIGDDVTDEGLAHLHKLKNLTQVHVTQTSVTTTGVTALENSLPKCKVFWDSTPDRKVAEWLLQEPNRSIQLSVGQVIRSIDEIPENEFTIKSINILGGQSSSNLDLKRLSDLPELAYVTLVGQMITDEALRYLSTCPNLKSINLASTGIDGSGVIHLTSLPIETLGLRDTRISDETMILISHLKVLKRLTIEDTTVGDNGVSHLLKNKLNDLYLDGTKVTDIGLKSVGKMNTLRRLHLDATVVTDAGIQELHDLSNLTSLRLRDTKVTASGIDALQKALPKCNILWNGAK